MSDLSRPTTTARRCPKCRSRSFQIVEVVEMMNVWEVENGHFDRQRSSDTEFGSFLGVYGNCGCGHKWSFKADQIDDICEAER
ncbi:hypothetical protein [Mesorhizobium sp. M8A.F.Ca.ET.021.01.1.1]|uniref:hypothetical protein n=1 Tax=Mesorhizobium sp. M8A.F.Ca.ET.021.01.1.1 TaxID=2496757 RepID=UPI000FCC9523|nr:hypothetical protein [Mesorhizobium sp. M8A.F.Ca.ET.021.01.1.1]RUW56822.1 hypothetical protein EOA36_02160 [Mesorhizobium sp. M8A.F.Ca.ET.021.01.1.1]